MKLTSAALLTVALGCASCYQLQATAQAGYTQMAIDGDIALSTTGGAASVNQSVDSAFGIGDPQGSPYVRAQADFGTPVLTVSAFTFDEQGSGTLNAQFGNITAGTDVNSDITFTNAKVSLAFDIPLGPIKIAPGIAADIFDLDMHVRDTTGTFAEDLTVLAPVPMAFVRGEADLLGWAGVVAELGYVQVPTIKDVKGTFWDAEVMLELRPTSLLHLFAGYRLIGIDAEGTVDGQDFATDLRISGWTIGGGIRF